MTPDGSTDKKEQRALKRVTMRVNINEYWTT